MNHKESVGSAVWSLSDVHEAEEQYRPLYATRLVGNEKWQAEVLLTESGVAIGYTGKPRRGRRSATSPRPADRPKRVMLGGIAGDHYRQHGSTINTWFPRRSSAARGIKSGYSLLDESGHL